MGQNPNALAIRRPFDPTAHELEANFRLTRFADLKGRGCKVPQEVLLKLLEGLQDDQSQEEMMIDEILSMSMDALLETPKVPDRLLSPMVRRSRPLMSALPRREEEISGPGQASQQSGDYRASEARRRND